MLRRGSISSLCALLLWIGGCPNRQATRSTLVYVPAKAPSAAPATAAPAEQQVLVIEEPAPPPEPEPAKVSPPQNVEPPVQHKARRPAHAETPTDPDEASPQETPETPPAELPALEPRESTAEETELHHQFDKLEQDIQQRLARLNAAQLSESNRKTLDDARTFFAQATHAMDTGDLQRALNLARKASLLLAALE